MSKSKFSTTLLNSTGTVGVFPSAHHKAGLVDAPSADGNGHTLTHTADLIPLCTKLLKYVEMYRCTCLGT